jgi:hypothetical protein
MPWTRILRFWQRFGLRALANARTERKRGQAKYFRCKQARWRLLVDIADSRCRPARYGGIAKGRTDFAPPGLLARR